MTGCADPRSRRRLAACLTAGLVASLATLGPDPAAAQGLVGFGFLPVFAWPKNLEGTGLEGAGDGRWSGSYARLSTGFEAVSSRHFGSYAGPTIGFEGGRMWQEGRFVYGIAGGFDYLAATSGGLTPGFGRLSYTRDFAGAVQVKVGTLLTPDVLLYARAGAAAVHGTVRAGATPVSMPFSRDDIAVLPNAHVGVEWAITDRLSVAVEAGGVGGGLR
ncbi:outer membrane protein [Methylobacterium aquaticum]|uniref:Outer membrane protein n=1 Tax=Methylobacterium aquaticum TaxID=270351 RepID=A0A0J6S9G2_9HYPH|nr:outer membrane protein [Methylobacterium aquaticum]KMO30312.1 outer membrane protein [Methylobacterium aquaticum]